MSYIGNNPSVKTVTFKGFPDFATADASPKRKGRFLYVEDEDEFYFDDGTTLIAGYRLTQLGTGFLSGGEFTIVDPTGVIEVAEGNGQHVDLSDPSNPTLTQVEWSTQNVTITNVGTTDVTYVGVDVNGNIVQQSTKYSPADLRDKIYLGLINHIGGTINSATDINVPLASVTNSLADLANAIGVLKVKGNKVAAVNPDSGLTSTDLSIFISSGNMFKFGANGDPLNPHLTSQGQLEPATFIPVYLDASGAVVAEAPTTQINVAQYNNEGTLATVAGSRWSVKQVFRAPVTEEVYVAYGTVSYGNFNQAIQRYAELEESFSPEGIDELSLIGTIIARGGATNFATDNNVFFIDVGRFGGSTALSNIDVDDIIVDTKANIDSLTLIAGKIYYATDEEKYYGSNGTDLIDLGGEGIIKDTKANLDALTKEAGDLFYATDENIYYGYGSDGEVAQVQTFTIGSANSGAYDVTFEGDTANILFNDSVSDIENKLNALTSITNAGGILVAGTPQSYTVTFVDVGTRSEITISNNTLGNAGSGGFDFTNYASTQGVNNTVEDGEYTIETTTFRIANSYTDGSGIEADDLAFLNSGGSKFVMHANKEGGINDILVGTSSGLQISDLNITGSTTFPSSFYGAISFKIEDGINSNINLTFNRQGVTTDLRLVVCSIDENGAEISRDNILYNTDGSNSFSVSAAVDPQAKFIRIDREYNSVFDLVIASFTNYSYTYSSSTTAEEVITVVGDSLGYIDLSTRDVIADTKANIDSMTLEAGKIYYATDEEKYYGSNGTDLIDLGSEGEGEVGGLPRPLIAEDFSDEDNLGFTVPAGFTVARETLIPLELEIERTVRISKSIGDFQDDFLAYPFQVAKANQGIEVSIEFDYTIGSGAGSAIDGEIEVRLRDGTNSVYLPIQQLDIIRNAGGGPNNRKRYRATARIPQDMETGSLQIYQTSNRLDEWDLVMANLRVGRKPRENTFKRLAVDFQPSVSAGAPLSSVVGELKAYTFDDVSEQVIAACVRVPQDYLQGEPLYIRGLKAQAANDADPKTVLIKARFYSNSSAPLQSYSSSIGIEGVVSETTVGASNDDMFDLNDIQLLDDPAPSSTINAGDLLVIFIYRDAVNETDSASEVSIIKDSIYLEYGV